MGLITIAEQDVDAILAAIQEHLHDKTDNWDIIHLMAAKDRKAFGSVLHGLLAHTCYVLGADHLPGNFISQLEAHLASPPLFTPEPALAPQPIPEPIVPPIPLSEILSPLVPPEPFPQPVAPVVEPEPVPVEPEEPA